MTDDTEDVVFEASDEDGDVKAADKLKALKEKVEVLKQERQEYLDGWQRSRADYANLVKAHEEDRKRMKEIVKEGFIADLIPVVDSFLMAMGNKEAWEKVDAGWRTGVEYIYNQLMATLESHGLSLFGEAGEPFDPAKHEAVSEEQTDDAAKDHTIAGVIQKGFRLGESVIRPARVTVYTSARG